MTYVLRFLPAVEADALTGYTWYEEKARGLGEEFLRMFYACTREIPRNPLLYPKVYASFGAAYSGDFHMPSTFG